MSVKENLSHLNFSDIKENELSCPLPPGLIAATQSSTPPTWYVDPTWCSRSRLAPYTLSSLYSKLYGNVLTLQNGLVCGRAFPSTASRLLHTPHPISCSRGPYHRVQLSCRPTTDLHQTKSHRRGHSLYGHLQGHSIRIRST
jgi:hypothetical protein